MSDKPISVGDLVMVARPVACGCSDEYMGHVFRVAGFRWFFSPRCITCKTSFSPGERVFHDGLGFESSRLKRIPPLGELDDVKQNEEITA